jgi:hypothetical protein
MKGKDKKRGGRGGEGKGGQGKGRKGGEIS